MVLGVDQHHFPDQHSVLYVDFEQAFLLDLLLLMANLISLTFLLILQLSHGGDCWAFISTCSADKILHGPATVKASYYLFVYWIVCQLVCRSLMVRARPAAVVMTMCCMQACSPLGETVHAIFSRLWLVLWWCAPVMYIVVMSMVRSGPYVTG